jgi:soluble lytic murein transglycosylase-like protein
MFNKHTLFKWLAILVCVLAGAPTSASAKGVYMYRTSYGQTLLSDKRIERPGFTLVKTLNLAYAKPNSLSDPRRSSGKSNRKRAINTTRYDRYINQAANKYRIDPALIKAIIHVESAFKRTAVSHAGAQGLMQLMPATAADYDVTDSFNPRQNINAGTEHLRYLMGLFDQDLNLVLAAYNAGQGNVRKYNGIPPFKETQDYVYKVKKKYAHYSSQNRR